MASAAAVTSANTLPSLPEAVLHTLFGSTWFGGGAALWNLFAPAAHARPASTARTHAPAPVHSPLPHQLGYDDSEDEAKISVRLRNMPHGARVSSSASGATLHVDTGKGAKAHAGGARSTAGDPALEIATHELTGGAARASVLASNPPGGGDPRPRLDFGGDIAKSPLHTVAQARGGKSELKIAYASSQAGDSARPTMPSAPNILPPAAPKPANDASDAGASCTAPAQDASDRQGKTALAAKPHVATGPIKPSPIEIAPSIPDLYSSSSVLFGKGLTASQFAEWTASHKGVLSPPDPKDPNMFNTQSQVDKAGREAPEDKGGADFHADPALDKFMQTIAKPLAKLQLNGENQVERYVTIDRNADGQYFVASIQIMGKQGGRVSEPSTTYAIAHSHPGTDLEQPDKADAGWAINTGRPSFVIGDAGRNIWEIGRNSGVVSIRLINDAPAEFGEWEKFHKLPSEYKIYNTTRYP
jgi:hypothetical protein